MKLVVRDPESEAVLELLTDHPQRVSSVLARVEVCSAVARCGTRTARDRAREVLRKIALMRVGDALLDHAAELRPTGLRSVDAIHLATASALEDDLVAIVTYDRRLADGAIACLMGVLAPR